MSPRSSDREREDEPADEDSLSDESEELSKEETPCNAGSSIVRETEDFTLDTLPSAKDSEPLLGNNEEAPSESPLSPPASRNSSTAASRRSSSPTSRGSAALSYDDLTPGGVGTFSAPRQNLHDVCRKVSQPKEKMVCRDGYTADEPELVGDLSQGKLYEIREKTSPSTITRREIDLVSCGVSPIASPSHDLHHLKTKVTQFHEKLAPGEVKDLDESDLDEGLLDGTRQNTHQSGGDEEIPSISHNFVNPPTLSDLRVISLWRYRSSMLLTLPNIFLVMCASVEWLLDDSGVLRAFVILARPSNLTEP